MIYREHWRIIFDAYSYVSFLTRLLLTSSFIQSEMMMLKSKLESLEVVQQESEQQHAVILQLKKSNQGMCHMIRIFGCYVFCDHCLRFLFASMMKFQFYVMTTYIYFICTQILALSLLHRRRRMTTWIKGETSII